MTSFPFIGVTLSFAFSPISFYVPSPITILTHLLTRSKLWTWLWRIWFPVSITPQLNPALFSQSQLYYSDFPKYGLALHSIFHSIKYYLLSAWTLTTTHRYINLLTCHRHCTKKFIDDLHSRCCWGCYASQSLLVWTRKSVVTPITREKDKNSSLPIFSLSECGLSVIHFLSSPNHRINRNNRLSIHQVSTRHSLDSMQHYIFLVVVIHMHFIIQVKNGLSLTAYRSTGIHSNISNPMWLCEQYGREELRILTRWTKAH